MRGSPREINPPALEVEHSVCLRLEEILIVHMLREQTDALILVAMTALTVPTKSAHVRLVVLHLIHLLLFALCELDELPLESLAHLHRA